MPILDVGEICACLGGAVLAEVARPAAKWKDSCINIAMGIFAGTFGPAGIEVWVERMERAHKLTIAICALSGAIIIRSFLNWLSSKRFMDLIGFFQRVADAARKRPEPT